MKKQLFIVFIIVHATSGLAAFLWLNSLAIASADAGSDAAGVGVLAAVVHYGLLQPLAHWVLTVTSLRWWTWGGLAVLVGLVALNSMAVAGIVACLLRACARRSGPKRL